jgi:hypothetical protein
LPGPEYQCDLEKGEIDRACRAIVESARFVKRFVRLIEPGPANRTVLG